MPHIKHLLQLPIDLNIVEDRLLELKNIFPKIAEKAIDLFYDMTEPQET